MTIKESYYYLFYKFYKVGEMSSSIFPSDFIAAIGIMWLELFFLSSFKFYYRDFINPNDNWELVSVQTLVPITLLVVIKYFAFINDTKWKSYFKKFDKFSQDKNDNGTLIVVGIVIMAIANFVVSVSLG